jgi:hypothetical protein
MPIIIPLDNFFDDQGLYIGNYNIGLIPHAPEVLAISATLGTSTS